MHTYLPSRPEIANDYAMSPSSAQLPNDTGSLSSLQLPTSTKPLKSSTPTYHTKYPEAHLECCQQNLLSHDHMFWEAIKTWLQMAMSSEAEAAPPLAKGLRIQIVQPAQALNLDRKWSWARCQAKRVGQAQQRWLKEGNGCGLARRQAEPVDHASLVMGLRIQIVQPAQALDLAQLRCFKGNDRSAHIHPLPLRVQIIL